MKQLFQSHYENNARSKLVEDLRQSWLAAGSFKLSRPFAASPWGHKALDATNALIESGLYHLWAFRAKQRSPSYCSSSRMDTSNVQVSLSNAFEVISAVWKPVLILLAVPFIGLMMELGASRFRTIRFEFVKKLLPPYRCSNKRNNISPHDLEIQLEPY